MDFREKSKELASNAEVREALKVLSKHGAGVILIHGHGDEGEFVDLPPSIIAYEEDLKVSFREAKQGEDKDFVVVGWRWDEEKEEPTPIMKCRVKQYCEDGGGL